MPLKDWNLEANEQEGMQKDPLNPNNDRFRAWIINSLFVDDSDPFYEVAYETNAVLNLRKYDEKRN